MVYSFLQDLRHSVQYLRAMAEIAARIQSKNVPCALFYFCSFYLISDAL